MPKPLNNPSELHYAATGTWTGASSWNAGDPNGVGTGDLVPLQGYAQNGTNYAGTQSSGNTLVMGDGHDALFLDDNISPGFNGGARLTNIDTIKMGDGGQLVDLTSTNFTLNVTSIVSGSGNDVILNNAGDTTINAGSGNDYVWTGSGNNTVFGGAGNDTLVAGNGTDKLYGGSGNDVLVAGKGNDVLDGGGGFDTADFSKLTGHLTVDFGNHTAVLTDAVTGAVLATDTIVSIEKLIGTNQGMTVDTGNRAGHVVIGGHGNDLFHIEGTSDLLSGDGGSNTYEWTRKFVAAQAIHGGATEITDFVAGQDTLNLEDFLKGQGIKNAQYSDVVQLHDTSKGTMVDVLAGGQWHDLVMLDNIHNASLTSLNVHGHMPLTV